MTLKQIRNIYFDADTNLLARHLGISPAHLRNMFSDGKEVMQLSDGNYILLNKHNKVIKVK